MKEIIFIIIMNFILLPIAVNRNLEYSNELLCASAKQKTMQLSNKARKILLLRSVAKSGLSEVRVLGFLHYVLVAYPFLLCAAITILLSLVSIVKLTFGLGFMWISHNVLVLVGLALMGYSVLTLIIFGFLSWISNKKQGL